MLAFRELAQRLQRWGAPAALVARCRTAATEEAVHAELLGDLAREAGANVESVTHRELPVDLARAALDNAVEGCVLEAWSAVVCAVAAREPSLTSLHASTPSSPVPRRRSVYRAPAPLHTSPRA